MIRRILIFIAAVLATLCAASLTHTQIILSGLSDLGAEIPFGVRLSTSLTDLIGLAPAFGSVIAIALLLCSSARSRHLRTLTRNRRPPTRGPSTSLGECR